MVLAAVLFLVSAIGSGLAFSPLDLIIWRVIGGLGVGAASVIAPAYIAEISPASIRGRMGSLQQLAIVTGIFVALLSDAFLARVAGGAGEDLWFGLAAWRWMFLTGAIPALVYGLMSLQIPESPRYLVARGETDEAREVLGQVLKTRYRRRGSSRDPAHRGAGAALVLQRPARPKGTGCCRSSGSASRCRSSSSSSAST